ncbi:MAG: DUF1559 domain-containing protein [Pirellulales bacterium]
MSAKTAANADAIEPSVASDAPTEAGRPWPWLAAAGLAIVITSAAVTMMLSGRDAGTDIAAAPGDATSRDNSGEDAAVDGADDDTSGDAKANANADAASHGDVAPDGGDKAAADDAPAIEPPSDPWQRLLFDEDGVAQMLADGPGAAASNVVALRAAMNLNRTDLERVICAARIGELFAAVARYTTANEENFPAGAAGSALLPPETRLSWIARILPELGEPAWYEQLRFGRAWDAEGNRVVAERPLAAVMHLGDAERLTADGGAVTQFVGMAGLGEDAALLDAADPRAGVFAYNKPRTVADVTDGLSQTIALISVADRLGPWAQGGPATVRAFTREPYLAGPDGFGSGLSGAGGAGALVAMADGSVRFLPEGTDPRLLEQLATIAGGPAPQAAAAGVPIADWLPRRAPVAVDVPAEVEDEPTAAELVSSAWLVDVERRLAMPVRDVGFADLVLEDFCSFVGRLTGLAVRVPDGQDGSEPLAPDESLTLVMFDTSVEAMLSAALATRGMRARPVEGGIEVVGAEWPDPAMTLGYDIKTLTGSRTAVAESVAALVQRFALGHPEGSAGDAPARIELDGRMAVNAGIEQQRVVVRLVGAFSFLAGVEPPVAHSPPEAVLGPNWQAIESRLTGLVSLPAVRRVGWARLAEVWHDALGVNLTLDAAAVAREEIPLAWPGNDAVANRPLGELLDEWLAPLGLAATWPSENTIRLTTATAASSQQVLGWHRLPAEIEGDEAARALTDTMRTNVAPGSWLEAGGHGDAVFDAASGYLLVRQSEPVQLQVQRYLAAQTPPPSGAAGGTGAAGKDAAQENAP